MFISNLFFVGFFTFAGILPVADGGYPLFQDKVELNIVVDGEKIEPKLTCFGKNKKEKENICTNLSRMMSAQQSPDDSEKISVFLGDQKFAGFVVKKNTIAVDDTVKQEHLSSYEMR